MTCETTSFAASRSCFDDLSQFGQAASAFEPFEGNGRPAGTPFDGATIAAPVCTSPGRAESFVEYLQRNCRVSCSLLQTKFAPATSSWVPTRLIPWSLENSEPWRTAKGLWPWRYQSPRKLLQDLSSRGLQGMLLSTSQSRISLF